MVVKRRNSPTMSRDTIPVETVLPLHHNIINSNSNSSQSDDGEEYETYYDDLPSCDSSARPLALGRTVSTSSSTDSLPLWTPQSARQALHMELSNVYDEQQSMLTPVLPSTIHHIRNRSRCGGGGNGRNRLIFTAIKRKHPLFFAVSVFCVVGLYLYTTSHATLSSSLEQVSRLAAQRRLVKHQFGNVEREIQRLQKEFTSLGNRPDGGFGEEGEGGSGSVTQTLDPAGAGDVLDEMMILQEKVKEGNSQIGSLQRHLQETSKRDAISKYGAGLIRVELELDFPESHLDGPHTIVMEMAPLNLMPHSVYMFLEMVNEKLFDGCSFILNAMHVIKAAPLPYDGSSASAKVKAFTKRGLESVAFREYSQDYPHSQYTVGFAADGSPSFYINTQDNTDIHIGDPCFGKIVHGFDTVKRLEQSPTRNGIWFRHRIGLKRARIL